MTATLSRADRRRMQRLTHENEPTVVPITRSIGAERCVPPEDLSSSRT